MIALYIASIATGSIALAITNTARPWHIGLYGNAGGLGPTQGHPLSSATDEPEPHWGPFGGAAPVSAGVGHAALVGALSVPHSWTTAAPEIQLAVQATPTFSSSAGADPTGPKRDAGRPAQRDGFGEPGRTRHDGRWRHP